MALIPPHLLGLSGSLLRRRCPAPTMVVWGFRVTFFCTRKPGVEVIASTPWRACMPHDSGDTPDRLISAHHPSVFDLVQHRQTYALGLAQRSLLITCVFSHLRVSDARSPKLRRRISCFAVPLRFTGFTHLCGDCLAAASGNLGRLASSALLKIVRPLKIFVQGLW